MGYKERCSRGAPCIFCGDVGLDMRIIYPETEDVVHWCHKTNALKGDIAVVGGKQYICIAAGKSTSEDTMGQFDLWKEYLSKEEWLAKEGRVNPCFNNDSALYASHPFRSGPKSGDLIAGEEKALSNAQLDERYRYMLDLLVLEDKHRDALLREWKSPVYDVSGILTQWPIRSLPPLDKARFKSPYPYKNITRKSLVKKMYEKFGDLKGIPGFYMRGGQYWEGKTEAERWTIAFPHEGVIHPCYDQQGYLYRLRIKDELPDLEVKSGKHEPYKGTYGAFHYSYDKEGYLVCHFYPEGGEPYEVDPAEVYGKPNGKYKNFSSVKEGCRDGQVMNVLDHGSRSGSPYSLYCKSGDSFSIVLATEGEKKAEVCNFIKNIPCISIPGVSSYNIVFAKDPITGKSLIETLKEKGMAVLIICYDADKEDNPSVRKAEQSFAKALADQGILVMIGSWPSQVHKGLDDILLMGAEFVLTPYQY